MIRKLAVALAIVAGTAFVAQPAFANDKADAKTAKDAKADAKKNADPVLAKLEKDAQQATQNGKTELASAINAEIDAYNKFKDAKASGDAAKIADAKAAYEKASKAADDAKKKASADKKDKDTKKK